MSIVVATVMAWLALGLAVATVLAVLWAVSREGWGFWVEDEPRVVPFDWEEHGTEVNPN